MAPDYSKLGDHFAKADTGVQMVEVDCTSGGQGICSRMGLNGYPTFKYFTPSGPKNGNDYHGGRDYNSIKRFAEEKLITCNIDTLKGCQPNQVQFIEKNKGKTVEEMGAALKDKEDALKDLKKERMVARNNMTEREKVWSRNERNINKAIGLIKQLQKGGKKHAGTEL